MFCSRPRIHLPTLNVTAHLFIILLSIFKWFFTRHYIHPCIHVGVVCCCAFFGSVYTMLLLLPPADAIVFRSFILS
jgi:hypothetical protein